MPKRLCTRYVLSAKRRGFSPPRLLPRVVWVLISAYMSKQGRSLAAVSPRTNCRSGWSNVRARNLGRRGRPLRPRPATAGRSAERTTKTTMFIARRANPGAATRSRPRQNQARLFVGLPSLRSSMTGRASPCSIMGNDYPAGRLLRPCAGFFRRMERSSGGR
jgi:hypothetical protein